MALVVADRVQETTTTAGTGTITLAGAVSGYQSFAVIGNGNTTYYALTSGTAWEVGIGTYTSAGTTLARTTILDSSAGGAAITLAGTSNVFCVYPADKSFGLDQVLGLANGGTGQTSAPAAQAVFMGFTTTATAAGTTTLTSASSVYQVFTGSTTQTVVLPSTATLLQGWFYHICNNSTGTLTVQTSTAVSLGTIPPGATAMVSCVDTTVNTAAAWEWGYTDFSTLTGTGSNVLANNATMGVLTLSAGTATAGTAPLYMTSGTNLTTAEAGALEYNGATFFATPDTTVGRGLTPSITMFKFTTAQAAITATATGTNFFGANSNIPLVGSSSAIYEIEIVLHFTATTANARNFSLIFAGAPTIYTVRYEMSPITGNVAPPGNASALFGVAPAQSAATFTVTTGSLTTAVNHYVRFVLFVVGSAAATSMKINAWTTTSGSITPLAGCYWMCTRLPNANVSNYAA